MQKEFERNLERVSPNYIPGHVNFRFKSRGKAINCHKIEVNNLVYAKSENLKDKEQKKRKVYINKVKVPAPSSGSENISIRHLVLRTRSQSSSQLEESCFSKDCASNQTSKGNLLQNSQPD